MACRSLQIFVPASTAHLWCHVQNFIVISPLDFDEGKNEFPLNFSYDGKIISEMDPRTYLESSYMFQQVIDLILTHWGLVMPHGIMKLGHH